MFDELEVVVVGFKVVYYLRFRLKSEENSAKFVIVVVYFSDIQPCVTFVLDTVSIFPFYKEPYWKVIFMKTSVEFFLLENLSETHPTCVLIQTLRDCANLVLFHLCDDMPRHYRQKLFRHCVQMRQLLLKVARRRAF
jgi:hypothetical protein